MSTVDCDAWRAELQVLRDTLDYVKTEFAETRVAYNSLWRMNRNLTRRINYETVAMRFYRRRARDYRLPVMERYISRITAQRIQEERAAPLRAEQERVISQIWLNIEQQRRLQAGMVSLTQQIKELEEKIQRLCLYEHVVLTANVETETEGVTLIISITVEYTSLITKRASLLASATSKIRRWFLVKFENVSAEPSIELVDPDPEVTRQLRQENADATLLHYSWYWRREGKYGSPGEEDEGDIDWDEEIPTVSQADLWGHRKHPDLKRRKGKGEGDEQTRL